MNDRIFVGISIFIFAIVALLASVAIKACVHVEREEEDKMIPFYQEAAREWAGETEVDIHCHRWGFCDVVPKNGSPPYTLQCSKDCCGLERRCAK